MAKIQITIFDADMNNIAVNVDLAPQFPESHLLYTNAQLVAKEILGHLQMIANSINDKQHKRTMEDAIRLD